jgi:hydrogenase maturation protease
VQGVIICIGNRFIAEDAAGIEVFKILENMRPLPSGVEIVEGGLVSLNLLPHLEQGGRVVFVDAVKGFGKEGEITLLSHQEILQAEGNLVFGHDAGLHYLLTVLPKVYDGELPEEIVLLGLEGRCSKKTITKAAEMSIAIATRGLRGLR